LCGGGNISVKTSGGAQSRGGVENKGGRNRETDRSGVQGAKGSLFGGRLTGRKTNQQLRTASGTDL